MRRSLRGLWMALALALPGSVALLAALVFLACNSSRLDAGPAHPASTEAPAAPLTPVGSALEPNFEPQAAAPPGAVPAAPPGAAPAAPPGAAPAGGGHQHAPAPSAPASAAAPAPAAHSEHRQEPAAEQQAPPAATQWTCPMHPEIIRNEPGNCPICGMKLKPIPPKDGVKGSP